jgi:hypothetical protein
VDCHIDDDHAAGHAHISKTPEGIAPDLAKFVDDKGALRPRCYFNHQIPLY